jgi:LAO/AO transport system kinase
MGDDVQSFKAGVMEIADVFVINKADRNDTGRLEQELKAMLGLSQRKDSWTPPVVKTSATQGTGMAELADALDAYLAHLEQAGLGEQKRVERWRERLLDLIRQRTLERVFNAGVGQDRLEDYARLIGRRQRDPYSVVEELLRAAGISE